MARFKDAKGNDWVLSFSVNTIRRIREETDEDLTRILEGDLMTRLAGDAVLFGRVLWVAVAPQSRITEEEFYDSLAGDALESAAEAFLEALVDFFPKQKRELLRRILTAGKKARERMMGKAEQELAKELERVFGDQSMNSPDASE